MADNVIFKTGDATDLDGVTKVAGQILFSIDSSNNGDIYFDKNSSTRIKMTDDTTKITKTGDTFTGPLVYSTSDSGRATFSKDTTASIQTSGGVSVAGEVAATTVRIDDGASSKGAGCEMKYNSTDEYLEFVFS